MPKLLLFLLLVSVGIFYFAAWKFIGFIGWTPIFVLFLAIVLYGFWRSPPPKPEFHYWIPRRR